MPVSAIFFHFFPNVKVTDSNSTFHLNMGHAVDSWFPASTFVDWATVAKLPANISYTTRGKPKITSTFGNFQPSHSWSIHLFIYYTRVFLFLCCWNNFGDKHHLNRSLLKQASFPTPPPTARNNSFPTFPRSAWLLMKGLYGESVLRGQVLVQLSEEVMKVRDPKLFLHRRVG